jgi:chromosome segregation ATPase
MAEQLLQAAKIALDALMIFMRFNPLAIVVGLAIKEAAVRFSQKKLEQTKVDLAKREGLLQKRVRDHETAKVNTQKATDALKTEQDNLATRNNDLTARKTDVQLANDKITDQKRIVADTEKQNKDLQDNCKEIQQKRKDKTKQIENKNKEVQNQSRKLTKIQQDTNDLKKNQADFNQKNQKARNELASYQQEQQKKINEYNTKNAEITNTKEQQTRIKGQMNEKTKRNCWYRKSEDCQTTRRKSNSRRNY